MSQEHTAENGLPPEIVKGDARNLPLDDGSVDLIVTSPPYFGLRAYEDGGLPIEGQIGQEPTLDEFVDALVDATREAVRVLKPSGSLWVNLGDSYAGSGKGGNLSAANSAGYIDLRARGYKPCASVETASAATGATESATTTTKGSASDASAKIPHKSLHGTPWRYALRCVDELGLTLRTDVIWLKASGLPDNARDRVARRHEAWFHFTKSRRYYFDADYVKTLPASVWRINPARLSVPKHLGTTHIASFPIEFPLHMISGWCPPGGTVLDPFGGAGTTALAAHVLGRRGISVDLSADYCRLAEWRIADLGQIARARALSEFVTTSGGAA